ncbi:MAG: hypothetical protein IJZ35_05810 [Clostridia bacterium]|nr:hypothetical protein [Clostridia bacterium]
MPKWIKNFLYRFKLGVRFVDDTRFRILATASASFAINVIYAFYNGVLGIIDNSWWYVTFCVYYLVLSVMRIYVITGERKADEFVQERRIMRVVGALLIVLSTAMAGSVILCTVLEPVSAKHEIVMITIALYTTIKVTLAIMNAVKARKFNSPILTTIRNISCADAAASVVSLQRSMFVSFGDAGTTDVFIMNIATGTAAFLFILVLGIFMIVSKQKGKRN